MLNSEYQQQYHSHFGAIQESNHVFLQAGLRYVISRFTEATEPIHVAELGFGTGLNAHLVHLEAEQSGRSFTYFGTDLVPIDSEVVSQLNYPENLGGAAEAFHRLHALEWGRDHELNPQFTFRKELIDHLEVQLPANHFHVFFFDAFAPQAQPELWTAASLQIAYDCLRPGGALVTYCAKGDVKRALKSIGFTVETLPGPPGKREMTRAVK